MTAQDLGWGPPGLSRTERVPCPGIQLNVRPAVAPLFRELVRWLTAERARHGAPPLSSSGGYNKRYVRGSTTTWSNHSWGLAADFNAAANPMQRTLLTDMPPGTSAKAKALGMRWGGDYTGRKDPMHFEVVVTPAEAARIVAALRAPTAALKTAPAPAPTVEDDMPPAVRIKKKSSNQQYLLAAGTGAVEIETTTEAAGWASSGIAPELKTLPDAQVDALIAAAARR